MNFMKTNLLRAMLAASFIFLFSCQMDKTSTLNELVIAPVLVQKQGEDVTARLDFLAELGFNSILFIGTESSSWASFTIQAQGRDMYAFFMVDSQETSLIVDYIVGNGVDAKIDGIWLSQGDSISVQDLKKIRKSVLDLKKEVKDRSVLGQLFVQSAQGNTMSFLHNGKLLPGIVYFDHSAAGLLRLAMQNSTEESPVPTLGADIIKMYNWRNFYMKNASLLVPLAVNFSYAFAIPEYYSLITGIMASISGPAYVPIALTVVDKVLYTQDLKLLQNYLSLRSQHSSLYDGTHTNFSYTNGVYVDLKDNGKERIIIACNFNEGPIRYRIPYLDKFNLKGKSLKNLSDGRRLVLTSNELEFDFSGYEIGYWLIE